VALTEAIHPNRNPSFIPSARRSRAGGSSSKSQEFKRGRDAPCFCGFCNKIAASPKRLALNQHLEPLVYPRGSVQILEVSTNTNALATHFTSLP